MGVAAVDDTCFVGAIDHVTHWGSSDADINSLSSKVIGLNNTAIAASNHRIAFNGSSDKYQLITNLSSGRQMSC